MSAAGVDEDVSPNVNPPALSSFFSSELVVVRVVVAVAPKEKPESAAGVDEDEVLAPNVSPDELSFFSSLSAPKFRPPLVLLSVGFAEEEVSPNVNPAELSFFSS